MKLKNKNNVLTQEQIDELFNRHYDLSDDLAEELLRIYWTIIDIAISDDGFRCI